jgi:hypothetical protein
MNASRNWALIFLKMTGIWLCAIWSLVIATVVVGKPLLNWLFLNQWTAISFEELLKYLIVSGAFTLVPSSLFTLSIWAQQSDAKKIHKCIICVALIVLLIWIVFSVGKMIKLIHL